MSLDPMKILNWQSSYSINRPEIDREHETFFGIINRLHEAMLAGQGKEILERLLAELVQYAVYHFANEERVMASTS